MNNKEWYFENRDHWSAQCVRNFLRHSRRVYSNNCQIFN